MMKSSRPSADTTIICGGFGSCRRTSSINAKPSICGMMRSSTITSTRTLPSASSASAPDGHSATTFMPSCRAR